MFFLLKCLVSAQDMVRLPPFTHNKELIDKQSENFDASPTTKHPSEKLLCMHRNRPFLFLCHCSLVIATSHAHMAESWWLGYVVPNNSDVRCSMSYKGEIPPIDQSVNNWRGRNSNGKEQNQTGWLTLIVFNYKFWTSIGLSTDYTEQCSESCIASNPKKTNLVTRNKKK